MSRTALWLRVFVALLVAILPPTVALMGAALIGESLFATTDPTTMAVSMLAAIVAWAALLGVVFTGGLADEFHGLLTLARRGGEPSGTEVGDSHRQLALTLDERNRQVAALAGQARALSIDAEPREVVRALVSAVRSVMRDSTWAGAILSSDVPALPVGVYQGAEEAPSIQPIGDLEQWASLAGEAAPVRHADGPWGAFAIVDLNLGARGTAMLYAPWEGRQPPTPVEVDLLTLVGQHASAALEHSLLYAQVQAQADELQRMARVQADFLRGVTHDLQSPLTSIAALATELRADGRLADQARQDLDSIAHQAERLRRMVSQLLVASRIEAGVITAHQEVFAVPPLVERTWTALRADRPFDLAVSGTTHLAVADPDRIEQVLWAVLDNAVKYSPDGSPIRVRVTPVDSRLSISVTDEGAGMDPESRERAFEQFYRSERARALAPDGSGVGLYAARGLMSAMGGEISLKSHVGRGTTVTLTVPAEAAGEGD